MHSSSPEVATFSTRALLDEVREGVVVCDGDGWVVYANAAAKRELGDALDLPGARVDQFRARLETLGARRAMSLTGDQQAFLFPIPGAEPDSATLAERERRAIVTMLEQNGGRLAETARRLGISRTTLWRRLRAYGLRPASGGR